ncbi:SDR family NAD(P)-dependent oxidoreductase [Pseudoroseomonas wenyumeiae]
MAPSRPIMLLTGASRGIGHATVKRFQAEGWRILTVSRQPFSEECRWPEARRATFRPTSPTLPPSPRWWRR